MANTVTKDTDDHKKNTANNDAKKKELYGRRALMPDNIFELLPYKETHEALKDEDEDALKALLCSFV